MIDTNALTFISNKITEDIKVRNTLNIFRKLPCDCCLIAQLYCFSDAFAPVYSLHLHCAHLSFGKYFVVSRLYAFLSETR